MRTDKKIDCLLIGPNELSISKQKAMTELMGSNSNAQRALNLRYINYNNKSYILNEILELFYSPENFAKNYPGTFSVRESLNAAISCLGSYLHRNGLSFDYVNSFLHEKESLKTKLVECDIKTIAITTTFYTTPIPVAEIIKFIRENNDTAKIIVGGPFIFSQFWMNNEHSLKGVLNSIKADFFINSKQGENTLTKLIYALKNNESIEKIDNIAYFEKDKLIIHPFHEEDNKIKENPVDWSLFGEQKHPYIIMRTSISCPYSCSFCEYPKREGDYQVLSVEEVENNFNEISKIPGVKSIEFIDDTFNIPKERFKSILKMMIKNKYDFRWHSYYRAQYADKETIELMKMSGCDGVFLGIESGSQKILNIMNKKVSIDKYRFGLELLNRFEIPTYASFIIGFPGETEETVQETYDFIEQGKPTFFIPQQWYYSTISPIWEERNKYNIEGSGLNWSHNTYNSEMASNMVDSMVLNIKNSILFTAPLVDIFRLAHNGVDFNLIKEFVKTYNISIKKKLTHSDQKETDAAVIEKLKNILPKNCLSIK